MNTTAPSISPTLAPPSSSPTPVQSSHPLEQSLQELKHGRRLEQVASSIESFLLSQVAKVSDALAHCQQAVDQNQIVQRVIADFEKQKEAWEIERDAEAKRLFDAGEKLIEGWRQLEQERQNWLAGRN